MTKGILALSAVLSSIVMSCEVTVNDGMHYQRADAGIQKISFIVDTTYMLVSPGRLVACGLATNDGPGMVSSPWWVECQFYTDSTFTVVLGKSGAQIGVPLSPGQSAYWTISFSSGNVDVRRFPDFAVGDFKAVYSY